MTLLQILQKAAGASLDLAAELKASAAAAPDVAPQVQALLAQLETATGAENLVALATALPGEIASIASGKLDPRTHAGDGA